MSTESVTTKVKNMQRIYEIKASEQGEKNVI
jgi:hypothetical protein